MKKRCLKNLFAVKMATMGMLSFCLLHCSLGTSLEAAETAPFKQGGPMFVMPGQAESMDLKKTFSADDTISLKNLEAIYGLAISAKADLPSSDSLVRVILVSGDNEYLVFEGYPSLSNKGQTVVNHYCEETCALEGIAPESLKIQINNGSITIHSIAFINGETAVDASVKSNGVAAFNKKFKQMQDKYKAKKINEKNLSWFADETSVSQLTYQEKKTLFRDYASTTGFLPNLQGLEYYAGGIFELQTDDAAATAESSEEGITLATQLPSAWDWRNRHNQNWVTPVKNQGSCGSCWAFSATGATETLANLYFNQHLDLDLAEQDVLSCSGGGSCDGGYPTTAASFIQTTGVVNEACFPYKASDLACTNKCSDMSEEVHIGGRTSSFYSSQGEDALKEMIINNAVSGRVDSWWHAMHLVGYGTVNLGDRIYYSTSYSQYKIIQEGDPLIGQTYWIFKNSWGTGWGESGFCRINLPLSEFDYSFAVLGPVTTLTNHEILCEDLDNDGYCNWGLSSEKPSNCPSSCFENPEKDCDDSNPTLAGFDDNYNCIDISICNDSDGGQDYLNEGSITGIMSEGENYDLCVDNTYLREVYCDIDDMGAFELYDCSPGICRDGACVTTSCSDSDGGANYETQGQITGYMADASYETQDYCIDSTQLYEVYCSENLGYYEIYSCPETTECQNGKCIEIIQPEITITYPADGSNVSDKFLTVTTSAANTSSVDFYINDLLKASDSSSPFSYKFNTQPYYGQTVVLKVIATSGSSSAQDSISFTIGANVVPPDPDPVTITECNDGKDNDGDGTCDWNGCPGKNKNFPSLPADPQCSGPEDTSEN